MIYEILSATKDYRRKEYIDTKKNKLFRKCLTIKDIEARYLAYWQLDPNNADLTAIAIPVNIPSKGDNWGIKIVRL